MEGLQGLLTDDQKKAREEALKAGKKRREVLESLKLTDEQKEKVRGRRQGGGAPSSGKRWRRSGTCSPRSRRRSSRS